LIKNWSVPGSKKSWTLEDNFSRLRAADEEHLQASDEDGAQVVPHDKRAT